MVLLAIIALTHVSDPFARYAAYRAAHPSFGAAFSVEMNGMKMGTGSVILQPPRHLLYKLKGRSYNFSLSLTEKGYVEIENADKVYDEYPALKGVFVYASKINPAASDVFPTFLFQNKLSNFPEADRKFTKTGDVDHLYGQHKGSMSTFQLWMDIDGEGRILRYKSHTETPMGSKTMEWNFSGYDLPHQWTLSTFYTPVPLGYVPHALPRGKRPMSIGEAAPLSGWVSPAGKMVDLSVEAHHKPFLIAVLDEDSPPCDAVRPILKAMNSRVPTFIVGRGGYRDPAGTSLAKLSPAGFPMFYLVSSSGKVAKLWMGYDKDASPSFETEVLSAAAK